MSWFPTPETTLPDQPDGIDGNEFALPDVVAAAVRLQAYVRAMGDGLYDVCGVEPLYGRDIEAVCRAILDR